MTNNLPKGFTLLIALLMLLLLAGYLWLAEILPKSSPLPTQQELRNTASEEPQLPSITEWSEYRDPKYGFSFKHPQSWQPVAEETTQGYQVRFEDAGNTITIKVYPNTSQQEIVQALNAKAARGLFPPTQIATLTLADDSRIPAFFNYSSPRGDANINSAVVTEQDTVFVVELMRSIDAPDYQATFPLFVRSFQG